MKSSFSWLTPKQAALLSGYTARHIQNLIVSGKISASKEDGKYYIDKSEFFRVFPDAHKKELEGGLEKNYSELDRLEYENSMLKEMSSKKDKEIEFLRNQAEMFSTEKMKMLDTIINQTKLLDHKKEKNHETIESKHRTWRDFFTKKTGS